MMSKTSCCACSKQLALFLRVSIRAGCGTILFDKLCQRCGATPLSKFAWVPGKEIPPEPPPHSSVFLAFLSLFCHAFWATIAGVVLVLLLSITHVRTSYGQQYYLISTLSFQLYNQITTINTYNNSCFVTYLSYDTIYSHNNCSILLVVFCCSFAYLLLQLFECLSSHYSCTSMLSLIVLCGIIVNIAWIVSNTALVEQTVDSNRLTACILPLRLDQPLQLF
jgi:hypothetical protein